MGNVSAKESTWGSADLCPWPPMKGNGRLECRSIVQAKDPHLSHYPDIGSYVLPKFLYHAWDPNMMKRRCYSIPHGKKINDESSPPYFPFNFNSNEPHPYRKEWKINGSYPKPPEDGPKIWIGDLLEDVRLSHANCLCMQFDRIKDRWITFGTYADAVYRVGRAMREGNDNFDPIESTNPDDIQVPQPSWKILLFLGEDIAEYVIMDHACLLHGITTVSLGTTENEDKHEYIRNVMKASVLFTTAGYLPKLVKETKFLANIDRIIVGGLQENTNAAHFITELENLGIKVIDFQSLHKIRSSKLLKNRFHHTCSIPGHLYAEPNNSMRSKNDSSSHTTDRSLDNRLADAVKVTDYWETENDIYSVMFTSGTTGDPKGVLLSVKSHSESFMSMLKHGGVTDFRYERVLMCLPFSHIYARILPVLMIALGAKLGFLYDRLNFIEECKRIDSTMLVVVPRILTSIHSKIVNAEIKEGGWKGFFLRTKHKLALHAMKELAQKQRNGRLPNHWLYSTILNIQATAREKIAPNLTKIISGGSGISETVIYELAGLFGIAIYQGWGMTETHGATLLASFKDLKVDHVGGPAPSSVIALQNWENYKADEGQGELLLKSTTLFTGYYKDVELTKQSFTDDGWFKTGDVVRLDYRGAVSIIDRSKALFKLCQGEYVAAEGIEMLYNLSPFVNQCMLHGESRMRYPLLLVEPDWAYAVSWAAKNGIKTSKCDPTSPKTCSIIISNPKYMEAMKADLLARSEEANLASFKIFKRIGLSTIPWVVDNDILTQTLKLRRKIVVDQHKDMIKQLVEEICEEFK